MAKKKPEYFNQNLPQLLKLCEEYGYEIEKKDVYQYRVYASTHIIDIWPSRMIFHRLSGENIKAVEPYIRELDQQFNKKQVSELLATGEVK